MTGETITEKVAFDEQVAVVTGGAQGIGRRIAEAFAGLSADVVIADVAIDSAEETARDVAAEYDATVEAVETDVTEYEDARNLVETTVDEFGRLDVLVNNAGLTEAKPFVETEPDEWEFWVGVCFFGTMNCMHAALPQMIDQGSGAIINFASDSYKGNDPGLAVYGAAKAANVSLTSTVAHEVGDDGVRVNCVSPGTTETPATEDVIEAHRERMIENSYALDRLGQPTDIADAVAFLASDAADWITGQTLSVNGGYIRG
ncbi:SDR family NAD(P)-dependent oxidoreductase [Natronorubrum tibetense]|uniref:Short-chain dehydrogenase/reductase SDR n=1 Tax=Natronorubrum tibetense GA33 TaxID=1114856 RepID=L9VKP9_9EURY|nr:glucose 1-dehydrogenase [Natronorubrum tibetense]ELY37785.1 short-chain dehydrogenase/reductase SDR [Natronorubrum tibetense GA33]